MIAQDLERLLALQAVDVALDDVARREAEARARLEAAHAALDKFRVQVKEEKKQLDDLLKERKTVELDIKQREEQVKKYSAQMYDVKTNKEYTALKEEIEKGKAENQKLEDKLLQLMIREDELRGAAGRRAAEVTEMEAQAKRTDGEVSTALAQCATERETQRAAREERKGQLGASLLRRYEMIRQARGGSPIARIVQGPEGADAACSECHMTVRPQIIVDAHRGEELVACESCGRILYLGAEPSSLPRA